jgi:Bacterial transcriptional activator domain
VEERELDLARFERLVENGGRALAEGRPADAADDLRAALALWSGSALADLGGEPVAESEAPRLEDRRGHIFLGQLDEAHAALSESFAVAHDLGFRQVMAYCLSGLAELWIREGDAERAIQALGASQHLFAEIGAALDPDGAKTWGEIVEFASAELGTDRAEELRRQGAELPLDEFTALLR